MPARPSTRTRWFGRAVALALCCALVPSAVHADSDAEAAERAAREIQAARDRANEVAQQLFDAESEIDVLGEEIDHTERRLAGMEGEVGDMRSSLADVAVRRFVAGGTETNLLLTPADDLSAPAAATVFAGAATGSAIVDIDAYDQAITDLDATRRDLQQQLDAAQAARDRFEQLKSDAEAEIVRLTEVEQQRLRDVEVRKALERQRAERLAQEQAAQEAAAAKAAAAAEAQAQAQADPPEAAPDAAAAPARAEQRTGATSPAAPPAAAAGAGDVQADEAGEPAADAPTTTAAPAPPATPPPTTAAPAGPGIVCPVAGAVGFADTWGAPRSGGRRHEGVDMISAYGTPLVAAESGFAKFKTTRLGGNSISLQGSSGTRYFYAHLSSWAGSSRNVSKGEVIGYVGSTGDTSVNHLHFEVHPGGGAAVNPYPYVRAVC